MRASFRVLALAVVAWAVLIPRPFARGDATAQVRVDPQAESTIVAALRYLAAHQAPDGSWGSEPGTRKHVASMTGYVLIAFMAAGNLPDEGEFRKNVRAGMDFLLGIVQPDGQLREADGKSYMYSHGIVTIALATLYGQSPDPAVRQKLERLVRVILASQNREGGWRYQPRPKDGDISVTVVQVVALRAALNAGIAVPPEAIDRAVGYVRSCSDKGSGGFIYQPFKGSAGFARTAAAVYSLQVCGGYEDPLIDPAVGYILQNFGKDKRWFTYGNYYAAPALFMVGGDHWRQYYGRARDLLLANVKRQGEAAYWGTDLDNGKDGVGPIYTTAVYSTILAMPYQYIPLYQR